MDIDKKILQQISYRTLSAMNELGAVMPDMYSSLFFKFASELGVKSDEDGAIGHNDFDEKFLFFTDLNNKTSKNVQQLSDYTSQAISAIQSKDETLLTKVLMESESLRDELEKVKTSLYTDELTGAFNRKWLKDNFIDLHSNSFKHAGTLAMIDLNYFKIINDTYGHVIGDKVLAHVANSLKQVCETVIRYGGDEFILIFSSTVSLEDAHIKLHQLREDTLSKKLKAKNSFFKSSFSFGITTFEAHDSLFNILESADQNMYDDKRIIKTRVTGIEA